MMKKPQETFIARQIRVLAAICVIASGCLAFAPRQCCAQAGLRESLERLDRNQDGEIQPDEITPLARPYLERISKARGLSLDKENPIDKYQEAARIYYALKNGVAGRRIKPESDNGVRPFGPERDEPLVPEFGLPQVKYPYAQADLDEADRTLHRSDRDDDGYIDRKEAMRAEWTHRNPFEMDLDGDDRLSRLELAQRYARRRLLAGDASELIRKAVRTGNGIQPSRPEGERHEDRNQWWRRGGSSYWLTASLMGRFDANRNGRLELQEALEIGIPPGEMDANRDGELTRDELHAYMSQLQDEAGDLTEGLPGWFYELDADRDEQVAMYEFATEWTDEAIQEFASYDLNEDGLLTAEEVLQAKAAVGGSYHNDDAQILPPRKTVISEIEVSEDFLIGDLNVQVSITHTHTSHLDGYLTGPDGQRIELFAEVGGEGDHFDRTIFNDQAREPIVKSRPPFEGSFQPSGLTKHQPSLGHFTGKNAKGVWQLVIRGSRSDRFGMLHNWSLIVKPMDTLMEDRLAEAESEGAPLDQSSDGEGAERAAPDDPNPNHVGEASALQKPNEWWKLKEDRSGDVSKPAPSSTPPPDARSGNLGQRLMKVADKNGDGVLTIDEYSERDRARFGETDVNGDGRVDMNELNTAMQRLLGDKSE